MDVFQRILGTPAELDGAGQESTQIPMVFSPCGCLVIQIMIRSARSGDCSLARSRLSRHFVSALNFSTRFISDWRDIFHPWLLGPFGAQFAAVAILRGTLVPAVLTGDSNCHRFFRAS